MRRPAPVPGGEQPATSNEQLHIEVLDVERIVFDELAAGLDLVAHQGREHQVGFRVIFRAHFEQGRNIGDPKVLAEIAAQCGVQGWPEKAPDVSQLEGEVREMGISAVPTFIFERRHGVSGAYPAPTLADAIRQAATTTV